MGGGRGWRRDDAGRGGDSSARFTAVRCEAELGKVCGFLRRAAGAPPAATGRPRWAGGGGAPPGGSSLCRGGRRLGSRRRLGPLKGLQLRHQLVELLDAQRAAARRVVLLQHAVRLHRVRVHPQLPQSLLELISVDVAAPVRVEHVKGLAHVLRHRCFVHRSTDGGPERGRSTDGRPERGRGRRSTNGGSERGRGRWSRTVSRSEWGSRTDSWSC